LQEKAIDLLHAAISEKTWGKYRSGWKAFEEYENLTDKKFRWPLEKDTVRGFVVYCLTKRKIQPTSTKTYISALVMLHKIKGFQDYDIKDNMVDMLLKGADHLALANPPPTQNSRRVVTLPLLRHFGNKLAKSGWSHTTTQSLWTAGLLAFFGTIRMGEILSPREDSFDKTTTLTWGDIIYLEKEDSFIIHLKIPKGAPREGEFVDIFPFKSFGCCPVAALKKQKESQESLGRGKKEDPVFIFPNGKFLTTGKFNESIKPLFCDICDYRNDKILCHSFRAGIPSELSRYPEMMSSDDIKGWGRWKSDAYDRYTRLKMDQKKAIFQKITSILS